MPAVAHNLGLTVKNLDYELCRRRRDESWIFFSHDIMASFSPDLRIPFKTLGCPLYIGTHGIQVSLKLHIPLSLTAVT